MGEVLHNASRISHLAGRQNRIADDKHPLRSAYILSAVFCAAFTSTTIAAPNIAKAAQNYPTRPLRLIVPVAAGGGPDINARLIGSEIGKQMGQQVVVDNRSGASSIIGFEMIARAVPDGYTFGYLGQNFVTNPSLFVKLPYDSVQGFQPVILHQSSPWLMAVTPSLPIRTVKDLIEYARANPGKLSYGTSGLGGGATFSVELLNLRAGTNIVRVYYKGSQQAITDVIAGQIHLVCDSTAAMLPHVRSGRLRGLGITSLKRSPAVPELPTLDEAGIPGYEYTSASGYAFPAGVPRGVVMRLNAEINKALQSPTVIEKYAANSQTIEGGTPERYAEHIRSEIAKWAMVAKAAGIKPE